MKVGFVGCGVAIDHHLAALRKINGIEIAWFCDRNEDQAKRAMTLWGKGSATERDFSNILTSHRPDVIHVCTPPHTHAEIAVEALNGGCHVLLEKPMATTVDDARRILDARDLSGRKLCMMHNHLFDPPVVKARELIGKGLLGRLVYGEGRYFLDTDKMIEEHMDQGDHWVYQLKGKIAGEYTPHTLYLLQSFLGAPESIQVLSGDLSSMSAIGAPVTGYVIQTRFPDAFGRILVMARMPYGHFGIDLYGTRSAIHINMMDLTYRIERVRSTLPLVAARMESTVEQGFQGMWQTLSNLIRIATGRLRRRPGHLALIKAFYESVRRGTPEPVSGEEGLDTVRSLEVIESAVAAQDLASSGASAG